MENSSHMHVIRPFGPLAFCDKTGSTSDLLSSEDFVCMGANLLVLRISLSLTVVMIGLVCYGVGILQQEKQGQCKAWFNIFTGLDLWPMQDFVSDPKINMFHFLILSNVLKVRSIYTIQSGVYRAPYKFPLLSIVTMTLKINKVHPLVGRKYT